MSYVDDLLNLTTKHPSHKDFKKKHKKNHIGTRVIQNKGNYTYELELDMVTETYNITITNIVFEDAELSHIFIRKILDLIDEYIADPKKELRSNITRIKKNIVPERRRPLLDIDSATVVREYKTGQL